MADNMERSPSVRDLEKENRVLRAENEHLRSLLAVHGLSSASTLISKPIGVPTTNSQPAETMHERAKRRIALFMSLFRGREDVYSRRWENADGRSGYAPAARKDWNAINSSRLEDRRKVALQTRTLLPLNVFVRAKASFMCNEEVLSFMNDAIEISWPVCT
jgi:hypothetical protein